MEVVDKVLGYDLSADYRMIFEKVKSFIAQHEKREDLINCTDRCWIYNKFIVVVKEGKTNFTFMHTNKMHVMLDGKNILIVDDGKQNRIYNGFTMGDKVLIVKKAIGKTTYLEKYKKL